MPINVVQAGTPYFVLMGANRRFGPDLVPREPASEEPASEDAAREEPAIEDAARENAASKDLAVYGFSDKSLYARFCLNSNLALTPYPLVKSYLRSQLDGSRENLQLVIIDAVGPRDPLLDAATMQAVLEAQQTQAPNVVVAYQLFLDETANAYRLDANPSG